MKILFAGPGEYLACKECGARLDGEFMYSESDDEDFRFCRICVDYVDSVIKKEVECEK